MVDVSRLRKRSAIRKTYTLEWVSKRRTSANRNGAIASCSWEPSLTPYSPFLARPENAQASTDSSKQTPARTAPYRYTVKAASGTTRSQTCQTNATTCSSLRSITFSPSRNFSAEFLAKYEGMNQPPSKQRRERHLKGVSTVSASRRSP